MKTKNILILSVVAIGSLMQTSCKKDFLDRAPLHTYAADNYYASDDAVLKAVEPLYNRAWFFYNNTCTLGLGSQRANDAWNPYNMAEFARFQVTGQTEALAQAWSSLYMVVAYANSVIKSVPAYSTSAVSESVKNQAIGEAHLMRATSYFYMLRIWGPVILFEDNDEMGREPIKPLNTEEDVLKFIIRDLEKAAELMPAQSVNYHPSRYAAKAMLAKVLLAQSGWNKSTRDEATLQQVVDLCDEVIGCGQYSLLSNYENLFIYDYKDNAEQILALRWPDPLLLTDQTRWGNGNTLVATLTAGDMSDVGGWGGNLSASPDMIDLYNEDPEDQSRLRATFFTPGAYYDNFHRDEGGYTYQKNWIQNRKYVVGNKADAGGHLHQQASPLNTYIMRLADVYLIKAEAILGNKEQCSDAEGLAAFNEVRSRAGVKTIQELRGRNYYTFSDLIRERRIEFCMEYQNWFDMVTWYRWKPQEMLTYFNYQQYRGYFINDGQNDIIKNADGSISYKCYYGTCDSPWYYYTSYDADGNARTAYFNDAERYLDPDNNFPVVRRQNGIGVSDDNPIVESGGTLQDKAHGYSINWRDLASQQAGYDPIVITSNDVFLEYPSVDVQRNPYLKQAPVAYEFTW